MWKRLFDIAASLCAIVLLIPVFIIIGISIKIGSKGPILFLQQRVGRNNRDFNIYKFRTMYVGSHKKGLLTVGMHDVRITPVGRVLRKYKLDEFPQLFNVLVGDMSIVGPRPEVRKYVNHYNDEQLQVLQVRPGITDWASIMYSDENALLANVHNAEEEYINVIMPHKLKLNNDYIRNAGVITDIKIIWATVKKIIS